MGKVIQSAAGFSNEFSLLKLAHSMKLYRFPQDKIQHSFFVFLFENMKRMCIALSLCIEFAKIAFNGAIPESANDADIANAVKCLGKKYRVSKNIFSPRMTYNGIAVLTLRYIQKLGEVRYETSRFEGFFKDLKINKQYRQLLEKYTGLLEQGKTSELFSVFQGTRFEKYAAAVQPLSEFISNEHIFYSLPRINISVFSTMSAGKSTFINALLGHDYLPSKNEACTAKIASIADTDYIDYCLGYAVKNGKQVFCGNVDRKQIEEWNGDREVSGITLEGNLDRISGKKSVCVVHDTPGINYSGSAEHKKITLSHLAASKPDIVICLLDATQMHTTDFSDALEDLKKAVCGSKSKKPQMIFVINKADSYDSKKENLKQTIGIAIDGLTAHGFENPAIIPVSARAARLFKMSLRGKIDFSEDETDDFTHYLRFFSRTENNFNALAAGTPGGSPHDGEYQSGGAAEILIEGKTYERAKIIEALFKTGIPLVENLLNMNMEASE
jgi:ribosome biogenesis GTPase A